MEPWLWAIVAVVAADLLVAAVAWRMATRAKRKAAQMEELVPPLGKHAEIPHAGGGEPARIHFVRAGAGPEGRAPVALIHGLGGTLRHFTATIFDDLAKDHDVIALDRPGAGYSSRPAKDAATIAEQAALLRETLVRLGVARPVVVGHSFGGAVALAMAAAYPDDVAGVVLVAAPIGRFEPRPPLDTPPVKSAMARRLLAWTLMIPALEKRAAEIVSATFAPDPPPIDFATRAGGALGLRPSQLIASLEDQALAQEGFEAAATELGAVRAPVHAVFGSEDAILDARDHAARLAARRPDADITMIPGAGHMLPFSQPAAVLSAIRSLSRRPAD